MQAEQVIIVGAGPAGLATAIQLKRYGVNPLILERLRAGGLLWNANLVENYPGFPNGITGPRLVGLFTRQAANLDIGVTHEEVSDVSVTDGSLQVKTAHDAYNTRVLVVASGTRPVRLTHLVVPEGLRERIFYEVYDLLQVEGACIAIMGSGDAAFDYALNLSRKNRVTIFNRGDQPKCLPLLWERAQQATNITYCEHTQVVGLSQDDLPGLRMDCQSQAGELQFHADYLLVAIGRVPQLGFLSEPFLQQATVLEEQGVLYRIGDVKNGIFRQTSIAVGDGVLAAMKIYRYLKEIA
jgi:thioredoxin reductase (NADPH)